MGDGGESARLAVRLAGETAMMLRIEDLLYQEKADAALRAAKEYEGLLQNRAHQRGLHLMCAVALQRQGNYQEAIAAIDAAAAVAPPPERQASFEAPDYGPIKQDLLLAMAEAEGSAAPKVAQPVLTAQQIPQKFAVGSPYPNPFKGSAILPLELPEAAEVRVEVFDVLGRRVGVLLDVALAAGEHEIRFEARNLATGVYFVRAAIEPQEAEPRLLSWKLTLVE